MMIHLLRILILLCFASPATIHAETEAQPSDIKVAFIRDGFLWKKINNKEVKITTEKSVFPYPPQWSHDGKLLLYQKTGKSILENKETQNELWVYDVQANKHHKIFYDGQNPKWSPIENIIAFQQDGVLNVSDLKKFYNISLGVDEYEWQPDGKGFIASSSATLRPDGWTNSIIYTIPLGDYRNITNLTNAKKLFILPKELGIGKEKIMAINAGSFTYSPNGKWVSFIVSPTASIAMDSDMLCVISADGKEFEVIDEVIMEFHPKWAYSKNLLGYIAGGGRIVLGFKNKDLKVKEIPAADTLDLTPPNYAEMGFTWVDDRSIIVSRVKESAWSNNPKERPKPALYFVPLNGQEQIKITAPAKDEGDFQPIFLRSTNQITWLRKGDLVDAKGDLWIADKDGDNAKRWIRNVELYAFFPMNQ